mmetsp:Transcript_10460/g.26373  ORF Transcript_10460/g.26373 Transcript_10460/m.26373 type:complete len:292 (+) Transcript_10460:152-1027(+)
MLLQQSSQYSRFGGTCPLLDGPSLVMLVPFVLVFAAANLDGGIPPLSLSLLNLVELFARFDHFHVGGVFPTGLHHFDPQFLFSDPSLVGDLFGQMGPLELVQILYVPHDPAVGIPLLVGNGRQIQRGSNVLGLALGGEFDPPLNVPLSSGTPVFPFSSLADARVFFYQIHAGDLGKIIQKRLDFGRGHSRGHPGNVDASALFQFLVEILRLGQRQFVDFSWLFGNDNILNVVIIIYIIFVVTVTFVVVVENDTAFAALDGFIVHLIGITHHIYFDSSVVCSFLSFVSLDGL